MYLETFDIEKAKKHIKQLYSLKPIYLNYYNQPIGSNDSFYLRNETMVIVKPDVSFNRLFILSNNRDETIEILKSLEGDNVINVPTKGEISEWMELLKNADYEQIGLYERYYYTTVKKRKGRDTVYARENQTREIYDLFRNSGFFSPYTDYLPTLIELEDLISHENVIIHEIDGIIQGAFVFLIEGKKCYFRAWIDKSSDGLKLLFDMYGIMNKQGLNHAYFWVNSENQNVKSIHQLLGAKPDGLKDYTFIKKS